MSSARDRISSPLRYPGGKAVLTNFFADTLSRNSLLEGEFVEAFAGGAGSALSLLYRGDVHNIVLNDADSAIYAFWYSVLNNNAEFVERVLQARLTISEWNKQKDIYKNWQAHSLLDIGFATFYLNRCNRSGIITAGPIGGHLQNGKWRLNARFNAADLASRLLKIGNYSDQIEIFNLDAVAFLRKYVKRSHSKRLIYLDPPYYVKGQRLYLNSYAKADHGILASCVRNLGETPWIMTYDNVAEIKNLYEEFPQREFSLSYSAARRTIGKEILISHPALDCNGHIGVGAG